MYPFFFSTSSSSRPCLVAQRITIAGPLAIGPRLGLLAVAVAALLLALLGCVVRLCPSVVARARPQPARPRPSSRVGAHVAQRSACTPPSPPTPGSLYFQATWLLCSLYLSISIYHRRLKQTRRGIGNVGNIQCGISSISIPRRSTAQHTARYDAQHLHHRLHRN